MIVDWIGSFWGGEEICWVGVGMRAAVFFFSPRGERGRAKWECVIYGRWNWDQVDCAFRLEV